MVAFGAKVRLRRHRRGATRLVAAAAMLAMVSGCTSSATSTPSTTTSADPATLIVVPSGVKAPSNLNDSFLDDVALVEIKNDPGLKTEDLAKTKCYFRLENDTNEAPGRWVVPRPTSGGGWDQSLVLCGPLINDSETTWWVRGVILDDSGMLTFGPAVPGGPDEWQVASGGERGFRFDGETVTTT